MIYNCISPEVGCSETSILPKGLKTVYSISVGGLLFAQYKIKPGNHHPLVTGILFKRNFSQKTLICTSKILVLSVIQMQEFKKEMKTEKLQRIHDN